MEKTAIRNFAVWARTKLKNDIRIRAGFMGITERGIANPLAASTSDIQYFDVLSSEPVKIQGIEIQMRKRIVARLEQHAKESGYQTAYESLIENMASEWFNRLIAIRYMEINEYFPDQMRMLSSVSAGKQDPDIVSNPFDSDLSFTEEERGQINNWIDTNENDKLFRLLLLKRCNQLAECLPGLFEEKNDASEFFLHLSFIEKDGVIYHLVHDIPEEAWKDQVQVIGWMYQYYIAEKHDQVVNINKGTVRKEDIPAATQLFTTDWVVRYMVDNSLGRYWIERHPESDLVNKLEFFVKPKSGQINYIDETVSPEELTFLDDCMGSGHILVYAFDVLMEIYRERGYSDREAVQSIITNNLYGLDIDDRCSQLAYFAVIMKARSYDRRFLNRGITPHVLSIQESNGVECFTNEKFTPDKEMNQIGEYLLQVFKDAKEIGSLQSVGVRDYSGFLEYLDVCEHNVEFDLDFYEWQMDVLSLVHNLAKQAQILSEKYTVVTTNPPYMNKMDGKLKKFVIDNYKPYSGDLFSVFMYRNFELCKPDGYMGYMAPFVWMFIKTYESLRKYIVDRKSITTLVQMEYSAFEEATVPICTFVIKNQLTNELSLCFRLSDFKGGMDVQKQKVLEAMDNIECGYFYETVQKNLKKIPGEPIAYWMSEQTQDIFKFGSPFPGNTKKGVLTGDNNTYLRLWHEPLVTKIGMTMKSHEDMVKSNLKWFPVTSGGFKRKWYGNIDTVVNLENDGYDIKHNVQNYRLRESTFYFREAVTWTEVSSGLFTCRFVPEGILFGNGGPVSFFEKKDIYYCLGMLNSKITMELMSCLAPTINYGPEQISKIPVVVQNKEKVETLTKSNIELSKNDWDAYETSWDYVRHPLMSVIYRNKVLPDDILNINLAECYMAWKTECEERFLQLKANEEELNRIFIDIYGLQDELTPDVADKDITVHRIYDTKEDVPVSMQGSSYIRTLRDEVISLLSYAVGCMFGRYSLDLDGLVYAGGAWDESKYTTFIPDTDNVIPITDQKYMDDDIVERLCEFLRAVYGENSLESNLDFIATALDGKGSTSREVIRNYFLSDFFKDHCKTYQKRPIYWLFDSGKQNGFKALVYMHRWNKNTIGRVLMYLRKIQEKYEIEARAIDMLIGHMKDKRQEAAEEKRRDHLLKQIAEIKEYDERLDHMANESIDIDLDDGVKVNYEKVQIDRLSVKYPILAPIK